MDFSTVSAFVLTGLSVLLCIFYGIRNWHSSGSVSWKEASEEARWDKEEHHIEDEMPGGNP